MNETPISATSLPVKNISREKHDELKNLGYKGVSVVDDIIIPLNNDYIKRGRYEYEKDGEVKPWWCHVKDDKKNEGKRFPDLIAEELRTWLRTQ